MQPAAPQPTQRAQAPKPGRRMLRPEEHQVPAAVYVSGTKELAAARMISAGEWIRKRRTELGLKQREAAKDLHIPLRQLKTLEAIAKWPKEARDFVRQHSSKIPVGKLTLTIANRRWGSKSALLAALNRLVDGQPARKRLDKAGAAALRDPDVAAIEDRIRDRLGLRVTLTGDGRAGELRVVLASLDDHERLLELLGA